MHREGFLKRIIHGNSCILLVVLFFFHFVGALQNENSIMVWTTCETSILRRFGVTREESSRLVANNVGARTGESAPRAIYGALQCAWVNATIDGVTSSVRAIRVASFENNSNGTRVFLNRNIVWELAGGPGASLNFGIMTDDWRSVAFSFDVGTVDTSGIGYGNDGDCILSTEDTAKAAQCLLAPKAKLFSTDRAVDEMVVVMNSTGYQKHAVVGVSGGTFILKRLLQRYPTTVEWAIFDSILTKKSSIWETTRSITAQANVFLERCLEEESCKKLFDLYGGVQHVATTYSTKDNRCVREIMVNKVGLKNALLFVALNWPGDLKKLVMATVLRFTRCGKRDYNWLKNLYEVWLPVLGLGEEVKPNSSSKSRKARPSFGRDVHYYQAMEILRGREENMGNLTWLPDPCKDSSFVCGANSAYKEIYQKLNGTFKGTSVLYEGSGNYTGIAVGFAGDLDMQTDIAQARDWRNDYNTTGRNWFIELKGGEHAILSSMKLVNGKPVYLGGQFLAEILKTNATRPLNETRIREIFAESLLANYKSFEFNQFQRKHIGMDPDEPLFDETYHGNDWEKSNGWRPSLAIKILCVIVVFLCW